MCHGLKFAIPAVILSWSVIPTILGRWLKLDRAQSIANRVRGPPDENGGIVGLPYDCLLSDVEDPAEGSSLLFIVVDPSSGISCTVHGTILDDPSLWMEEVQPLRVVPSNMETRLGSP